MSQVIWVLMKAEQLISIVIVEGTELNYEVLNEAIGVLRKCSYVSADWKRRIDKDFKKTW